MPPKNNEYARLFATCTGFAPYAFQERFAASNPRPIIVEVPTGLGKTEAVVIPFILEVANGTNRTRRLVYVLPMRSLVDQTVARIRKWLGRLAAAGIGPLPAVTVLLGGDVDDTWLGAPDTPTIIIGTQDMILSRALNRGYAASPFLWPMAFGLLNNDAHWVLDEVQLQGVGVRTAAQLQGLRDALGTLGATSTTFVSATIQPDWIRTVDHPFSEGDEIFALTSDEREQPDVARRLRAPKRIVRLSVGGSDEKAVVRQIAQRHQAGTLTLVVLNTVRRAREVFRELRKAKLPAEIALLHSRFRRGDRARIAEEVLGDAPLPLEGRIVVSTQVVEAGVDIDAATLLTDLAPWASIVQRLGRCNRRGTYDAAFAGWFDLDPKQSAPYAQNELEDARNVLDSLEGGSVAPGDLPRREMPLEAGATLRRVDLLDLFDTTADLSGNDIEVGRFIREADDFTAVAFWRESHPGEGDDDRPRRDELCPVALDEIRALIERVGKEQHGAVWTRSTLALDEAHVWRPARTQDVRPGTLFCVRADSGGYDPVIGFDQTGRAKVAVVVLERAEAPVPEETDCTGGDRATRIGAEVTIRMHALDTAAHARRLAGELTLNGFSSVVERAALWHDVGKAHRVFQATMVRSGLSPDAGPWAKSARFFGRHDRPHFRHEVASVLAWFVARERTVHNDLVGYLIGAHHGKLRVNAYRFPGEPVGANPRSILGVHDGDDVAAVDLGDDAAPAFRAELDHFNVGSTDGSATWTERVLSLRDDPAIGPFRLAMLETIVRVADWRASAQRARREEALLP